MNIFVEYRFYAGTPWFVKVGSMQVIKEIEITYLRDDEWVFSGMSFTDIAWMGADGKLRTGPVEKGRSGELDCCRLLQSRHARFVSSGYSSITRRKTSRA